MTDPIADMLVRISNANHKLKESVSIPLSKIKVEIARVLKEEGYISGYRVAKDQGHGMLSLNLKYMGGKVRVIQGVKRVARSSLRVFRKSKDVPSVQNGLGTAIVSTSQGVMAGQTARDKKIGGEILAFIW